MKAGWEVKPLGEVATLHYGKALAKAERNPDGGVPVYGANGVLGWSDHVLTEGPSLIVGRKGSAGEINRADGPFWPSDVTYYTEHNASKLDFEFFHYGMLTLNIPSLAKGVKPGINRNEAYALDFPIPPLEEQKRIVAVLDAAFEGLTRAKENAEANLQNARELFESTLSYLFDQSEEWHETALNDHVSFMDYRGKTPPKREAGVRLITAKNVKRGFVQMEPKEFIDAEAYDGWMTRGFPEEGDVLFTTEAPLANVAQLDTSEKVVIGQRLITMKPDRKLIDREFLKFALMSPQMQEEIFSYATGATVLGIKAKLLKLVRFRFPSELDEQRKVAAQCRTSFAKMDELAEIYTTKLTDISDLRQSLLQNAFAGELT